MTITAHPVVDEVIARFAPQLGEHAPTYRNHAMRGLNYQSLLLGRAPTDTEALAWAVHDLGIWSAGTFDYLEPSAAHVAELAGAFGAIDVAAAERMVLDHHKVRAVDDPVADAFRRADLADASRGLVHPGLRRQQIRAVVAELPYLGFHRFLARGLTRHALRHPLNPAPMMRW